MRKYKLLESQRKMLENIVLMFKSNDIEAINLGRELVLNEPILDIIVGHELIYLKEDFPFRTLFDIIKHCTLKHPANNTKCNRYINRYNKLSNYIQYTLDTGYYHLLK